MCIQKKNQHNKKSQCVSNTKGHKVIYTVKSKIKIGEIHGEHLEHVVCATLCFCHQIENDKIQNEMFNHIKQRDTMLRTVNEGMFY